MTCELTCLQWLHISIIKTKRSKKNSGWRWQRCFHCFTRVYYIVTVAGNVMSLFRRVWWGRYRCCEATIGKLVLL